jgi:hypothetical protein
MVVSFVNLAFILGGEDVVEHYGFLWSGQPTAEIGSHTNHVGNRGRPPFFRPATRA